ncbi:MAG TPA: DNA methyltransferase [Clostridia bacterium]|nr:DNA methyltransferase [Clostridia bacterium]
MSLAKKSLVRAGAVSAPACQLPVHSLDIPKAIPLELPLDYGSTHSALCAKDLASDLLGFQEFGQPTRQLVTTFNGTDGGEIRIPTFVNEFWTARQRQASSLHEVSYRACFKPQLPRFFIERLTQPGEVVYDPFMGRGTTPMEAALLGRIPRGNDVNPLSRVMTMPRLRPPTLAQVEARLKEISLADPADMPDDLLAFYHPETLRAISSLKKYLLRRQEDGTLNSVDEWIALVALNRLTGHSNGFFSVYTLPPNQAVSAKSQRKINERRNQVPPERDVVRIILKKTKQLLGDVDLRVRQTLTTVASQALFLTKPAHDTSEISNGSVALVVTSPPFLDVVQYATDNWLRCWFLGIDAAAVKLTVPRKLEDWQASMTNVFRELHRILKPDGHIAFEVGEVHGGKTKLEEAVLPCGSAVGLRPLLVLINDQKFTKTANCWGVDNMAKGTNTNRIVVFRKI